MINYFFVTRKLYQLIRFKKIKVFLITNTHMYLMRIHKKRNIPNKEELNERNTNKVKTESLSTLRMLYQSTKIRCLTHHQDQNQILQESWIPPMHNATMGSFSFSFCFFLFERLFCASSMTSCLVNFFFRNSCLVFFLSNLVQLIGLLFSSASCHDLFSWASQSNRSLSIPAHYHLEGPSAQLISIYNLIAIISRAPAFSNLASLFPSLRTYPIAPKDSFTSPTVPVLPTSNYLFVPQMRHRQSLTCRRQRRRPQFLRSTAPVLGTNLHSFSIAIYSSQHSNV